ncbi:hypothetical protein A676_00134 [Salmonella enterica subsp. enterica serovar Enteritidis str. 2010K-0262]|nr:hypothetical protein CJP42_3254 [Salmonella enterica subsp. enterica serovar Typhi]EMR52156.1 hypothetical protein A670_02654 [Salmonella enterica subsp. enterica serovar Dublin str. UC16]EPI62781.1 hypothetical protein A671_05405 [Salmonella enterica subsp. enterica serovar Dublin str. DG22]EPI67554.1 hypothetical protein A673_03327 [Salmonella enterica subsp. enterica serovar Enteritidis str. 2009K0958]EPI77299.1 hypothetical protein A672_00624 [Salmonella enterica subsp. enterica serovar 
MAFLLKHFSLIIQSTELYGKFRKTASFCDDDYTISIRIVTRTGRK